jgi:hypothetical protein
MEESYKLHVPAAEPLVPIVQEAGCGLENIRAWYGSSPLLYAFISFASCKHFIITVLRSCP